MNSFSIGPIEEKVISSGYFEINCNIPGSIDGEITWLKDGNVYLIPSNRPVYFKNNKKTIVFLSVAPEDNGLYTCIVNNQYQASASTELFIKNKGTVWCFAQVCMQTCCDLRFPEFCELIIWNCSCRILQWRLGT